MVGPSRHTAGGQTSGSGAGAAALAGQAPATASHALTNQLYVQCQAQPRVWFSRPPGDLMNYPRSCEYIPFLPKSGRPDFCPSQLRTSTPKHPPDNTYCKLMVLERMGKEKSV